MTHWRYFILPSLVLLVGSLQIIGYVFDISAIRKLGQVTAASPLPLVFSHFRGLETFSPRFEVLVTAPQSTPQQISITPENYAQLSGPYNRRNVYGVAFAFGAVLQDESERRLVDRVLTYGFCDGGPLRKLLEQQRPLPPHASISIRISPRQGEPSVLEVACPS
jgi:hypothetical protein